MKRERNFSKLDSLENGFLLGGQSIQVGKALKAWKTAHIRPQFLGRTERLRQRLIGLRIKSLGLMTKPVKKALDQYERHLITQYIRHGGEYFYKTFKAPHGTPSPQKCKPYVRIQNED